MFDYTKYNGQLGISHEQLKPHPDGKAWDKCCKGVIVEGAAICCAFVKAQDHGARLTLHHGSTGYCGCGEIEGERVNSIPFMCCHRSTDDGYHRVCAGWDACFGNKAEQSRKQRG